MKLFSIALLLFALTLDVAFAGLYEPGTVQKLFINLRFVIRWSIVPFLLIVAFVFFVYNIVRYFIAGNDNPDDKTIARSYAVYSLGAFLFIAIFWGLVELLIGGFGFSTGGSVDPDYFTA